MLTSCSVDGVHSLHSMYRADHHCYVMQAVIEAQKRALRGDHVGCSRALDEVGLRWARQVGKLMSEQARTRGKDAE